MNAEFVILRLLHIVFGAFWVGAALFMAWVVIPRVQALGPAVAGPVFASLGKIVGPVLLGSGVITVAAGITLAFRLRSDNLDTWFDTGWGWAIALGFVMSLAALAVGSRAALLARKMAAMGASMAGREPTPEEMGQMRSTSQRLMNLGRISSILVLIALGTMASARFI
jgi:hypothetical protein